MEMPSVYSCLDLCYKKKQVNIYSDGTDSHFFHLLRRFSLTVKLRNCDHQIDIYFFIYLFIYLVTHKTLYNLNKSC